MTGATETLVVQLVYTALQKAMAGSALLLKAQSEGRPISQEEYAQLNAEFDAADAKLSETIRQKKAGS